MISCIFCKRGRVCPMHQKEKLFLTSKIVEKDAFNSASPPSIFIGSKLKYPKVSIGILSPPARTEDEWLFDAPRYWASNAFALSSILALRSSLINANTSVEVKSINSSMIQKFQEIGMAIKPVDVEIVLEGRIKGTISFENIALPQGPSAPIKSLQTSTIKIPQRIEKVYSDVDLKAIEGIHYLYQHDFDEQKISQLLSIGTLGLKKNRKLVPTRYSITATDDALGKYLINSIKDFKFISQPELHIGGYLGNYYFILLFPDLFAYELFESYLPDSSWSSGNLEVTTDSESHFGRHTYVSETAGGYYAARLPTLEHLHSIHRQAAALVLRFISQEYYAHLGVFVCREASRKAINAKSIVFNDTDLMLKAVTENIKKRFNLDITPILKKSKLLTTVNKQKKLFSYF